MKKLISFLLVTAVMGSCAGDAGTTAEMQTQKETIEQCDNPAVAKKVQVQYLLQTVNDFSPEEAEGWLREYESGTLPVQGLTGFTVDTTFDGHCILGISYHLEWMGAYPSSHTGYINYNLATGDSLRMQDVVAPGQMDALLQLCNKKLQQNIEENRAQLVAGDGLEDADWHIEQFPPLFTINNIDNFYISDTGITFRYEFDFPHVMQGMEPEGNITCTKEELRPMLNTEGALGFLTR